MKTSSLETSEEDFAFTHTFMRVTFSMSSFWDEEDKLLDTIGERGKEHKFVGLTKAIKIPAAAYLANKIYMFALRE
jgi:hypothetical protein